MKRDARVWLWDIHGAALRILEATADQTEDEFLSDWRLQAIVERQIILIGESIRQLSHHYPDWANRISRFEAAIGMRNIVVYRYYEIRYDTIWQSIQTSIPKLITEVEALLDELNGAQTE